MKEKMSNLKWQHTGIRVISGMRKVHYLQFYSQRLSVQIQMKYFFDDAAL